jgi:hypothetical protein
VAIHRLLKRQSFSPDKCKVMTSSYDLVCERLDIKAHRYDAANEIVALKIIQLVETGLMEVERVAALAIEQLTPKL